MVGWGTDRDARSAFGDGREVATVVHPSRRTGPTRARGARVDRKIDCRFVGRGSINMGVHGESGVGTERNPGVKKAVAEVESRKAMLRSGWRRGSLSVNTDSPCQECEVIPTTSFRLSPALTSVATDALLRRYSLKSHA